MKRMMLGVTLLVCGLLSDAAMIVAAALSPLQPWSYNGVEGWAGAVLGLGLLGPLIVFGLIALAGLALCVWSCLSDQRTK